MHSEQYGHFSENRREFIITNPRTPRPWFNYMWNERYVGLVSHTGGGFSCLESPRDNRITRMRYNCLPWDRPGRYVLVKDTNTGEYWSLSWAPTIDLEYDTYACHHGQGYTRIVTEREGIRGEIVYFVPCQTTAEVWWVTLTNLTDRPRQLEIYSFTELLMGNALNDLINQPNDKHFSHVSFDGDRQALLATRRYWVLNKGVSVSQPNLGWEYRVHFTQTLPITGFDGSLDRFIGRWRSESNPIAVETGTMGNSEISAGDPIVALQSPLQLNARGTSEFAVVLSVVANQSSLPSDDDAVALSSVEGIHNEFQRLQQYWNDYLSVLAVATPDDEFNTMLGTWNPYQAAVTFDMARNAGYYHGGLLFGIGVRDRFQDILGHVMVHPQRVRARLVDALRYQFQDGSTLHNFFRLTGTGERTHHSDTPLWIPFGIVEYLKETGDVAVLDESVPFYDGGDATVREHLSLALDYALANLSERGLPKIQNGDWNDTLDHVGPLGQGETVWGACFLGFVLRQTIEMWEFVGDRHRSAHYQAAYTKLSQAVNDHCWDGNWYLRAFRDNGTSIGSSSDRQGQIFLNAQSWAVLSGIAPADRAERALQSSRQHLTTPYGMQICWPSFTDIDDSVGLISRCVPGKKENGAVFNHASSWFVLASILNGDIEFAWTLYRRMMPLRLDRDRDQFETEPYVYPEYVTSPDHPSEGQASHSWLTGTAVWMLRVGVDYILGVKPSLAGLVIDPHIPAHWPEFRLSRRYRKTWVHLHVLNPHYLNQGVRQMMVNSNTVIGNTIDLATIASSSELAVTVTLER